MKQFARLILPVAVMLFAKNSSPQQLVTFNHLAIHVRNLKKSSSFYREVLQLQPVKEPFNDGKHDWLKVAEGITLHIVEGAPDSVVHNRTDHFCFSTLSISTFVKRLTKLNIPYVNASNEPMKVTTRVDGVHQLYIQDPDGYWIEMNDAKQ